MKYTSLFILLYILNLPLMGQNNPNADQQSLVLCDQIENGEWQLVCEQFHQSLLEKKLLSPQGTSAYDCYKKLEEADPLPGLVLALRIKLVSALREEIDQALEVASRITMTQTASQLIFDRDLSSFRAMAQKAAELSAEEGEEWQAFKWQEWYFAGLEEREKVRRIDSRDSSLLNPVIDILLEALKYSPDQAYVHKEIGEVLMESGRYTQGKNFLMRANAHSPDWASPFIGLSQFLAKAKEEEQALKLADKAASIQTDFAQSYLNAGHLYGKFDKPVTSLKYYELAVEKIMSDIQSGPEAFKWYNALLLSDLLIQFELYEQAEKILQKIIAHKEVPDAYLLLGELYEMNNKTLSADSIYRRAIALWPEHIGAYIKGGLLYQGIGRYAIAEPFFEQAYALNPKHREVCFNLGSLRHLYKMPEEAELLYEQSLAYPEGMTAVYEKMEEMITKMKNNDKKTQTTLMDALVYPEPFFKSNFAFSGPPVSKYEDFIYANLGDLFFEQDRTDEAIEMYKNALLLNPGLQEVYKNLIQAYYDKQDFKNAMLYIQLYLTYVPYGRDTKEDWKVMNKTSRELLQKKVNKVPERELSVYFLFMDNFWTYLYKQNQDYKGLYLDRTAILRYRREIQQAIRKNKLIEQLN